MTAGRVIVGTGRVVGAGLISAAAAVAGLVSLLLLPPLLGLFVESVLSTFGIVRTAVAMIIASCTSWFWHMSPAGMVLGFIVATTISAVVGGIIGAFLGCLGATVVLQRLRDRLEA